VAFKPRDYQQQAINNVYSKYVNDQINKMLLYLPTGAGKTVIATLIIEKLCEIADFGKILFIAHSQEILQQTQKAIHRQLPGITVEVEQGLKKTMGYAKITLASVQSLVKRKNKYNANEYSLIICDECHRSLAPSWIQVIEYFHDQRKTRSLLLGMTATPRRSDGRSALDIFDHVGYEISSIELQGLGYLVPMQYYTFQTNMKLDEVKMSGSDFQTKALSKVMMFPEIRQLTLQAWFEKGRGKKTIAFCAGVQHTHQLVADFREHGINAVAIDGKTKNRDQILQSFANNQIDLIANYGVLTEGFDEPSVECILLARPTTSPLVYIQCVGRGLRPYQAKSFCTVIDIIDRSTHQLQYGAAEMAGLPKQWKSRGRDPLIESRAVARVKVSSTEAFLQIKQADSLEMVQSILMSLPSDQVVSGLDGFPQLYYQIEEEKCSKKQAKASVLALLKQAKTLYRKVMVDDEKVVISFSNPETNNEKYFFMKWHLQRLTQREIEYTSAIQRKKSPRAMLKSLLLEHHQLKHFEIDEINQVANAIIMNLSTIEADQVVADFYVISGLKLEITGQLSFSFL
jgi:ATP-dependent helicase IRC3